MEWRERFDQLWVVVGHLSIAGWLWTFGGSAIVTTLLRHVVGTSPFWRVTFALGVAAVLASLWLTVGGGQFTGQGLEIARARYGTEGKYWNVTKTVRSLVSNNSLSIPSVQNYVFSQGRKDPDPIYGKGKRLTIRYRLNGRAAVAHFDEGQPAALPASRDESSDGT